MISHEIKICVICVTDTLCHISKDGSVHDLERVVKGLFIDSCYFNNINLKAFEKYLYRNIFTLILFLIPETLRQIGLNFLFTFSACKRPFNKTKHCDN